MTTPNFEESPPPQSVPSFRRPADYYAGPTPERAFPLWVTFGCGGLALVILLAVFGLGVYMSGDGFNDLMDMSLGMTMGQMRGMYQKDVTDEQKKALDAEIKAVRGNIGKKGANLQPLMQTISRTTGDEKLTRAEVDQLIAAAKKVNAVQ